MIEGGGGEEGDGSPFMLRSNLILSQLLRQIRSRYHLFAFALYEPLLLSLQELLRGSLQLQQWIRTTERRNDEYPLVFVASSQSVDLLALDVKIDLCGLPRMARFFSIIW
ncbi:hypothetical protein ACFX2I_015991 [Malus domestica]|uniref:Uncharacterized protein n=1 Tax=Malus baccata TaxID=106549 RepID=A0A540N8W9_MALBA|nr:hypothetical protein C1H46_006821 [Malus baccata]